MTIRCLFLFAVLVLVAGCTQRPPMSDAPTLDLSASNLAHATTFGFGVEDGQEPDARPTDGEFEALLCKVDARKHFVALFKQGSICAKLYSLCALHHLDRELFQELAETLSKDEKIWTQGGCVHAEKTVGEVIEEIDKGQYDYHVKDIIGKQAEQ